MSEPTEAQVDAAEAAYNNVLARTEECGRCEGRGYHHGFGERGHDPDWCEVCGGAGYIGTGTEHEAMRAALQAANAVTSCCYHQRYDVTPPTPSHPQPSVSPDDT